VPPSSPEDPASAEGRGRAPFVLDRYELHDEIASGGMATVHFGRLVGAGGFARTVAIKRLHPSFAKDPELVAMFLDEARLATRIRHPNVVPTLDVVAKHGELFLVMEFVLGESLGALGRALARRGERIPPAIAVAVVKDVLYGLHAAHEATSETGAPLRIVHRDVSPQNILVGADGVARVLDFGVAKAVGRLHTTREGQIKGKLAYMAPEQVLLEDVDRRVDVFAAAVVLWEALAGTRLFASDNPGMTLEKLLKESISSPSAHSAGISRELDAVVLRGLERHRDLRFATARDMAVALEGASETASPREISEWLHATAGDVLAERGRRLASTESSSPTSAPIDVAQLLAGARVPSDAPRAAAGVGDVTRVDGREEHAVERDAGAMTGDLVRMPRRSAWPIAGAALIATLALGGVLSWMRAGRGARLEANAALVPSALHGDAPPSSSSTASALALPSAPSTAEPAPSDSASASASAAPSSIHAARPIAPKPARARPDCSDPFRVDAQGIVIPRKECF
jgi:serine/threonine-protein kinase